MANPTYRCPFKNNAGTGLTCENTNCAAYDATEEHCVFVLVAQRELQEQGGKDPNNA